MDNEQNTFERNLKLLDECDFGATITPDGPASISETRDELQGSFLYRHFSRLIRMA
jgi:hypothetical protein